MNAKRKCPKLYIIEVKNFDFAFAIALEQSVTNRKKGCLGELILIGWVLCVCEKFSLHVTVQRNPEWHKAFSENKF